MARQARALAGQVIFKPHGIAEPAAPTGKIFKLAGEGGGLAGPARGLAGEQVQQEVNKDVSR